MRTAVMTCRLWMVPLVLLSCTTLGAASGGLRGTVVDAEGAALDAAHVLVHEDRAGKTTAGVNADLILKTDRAGRFVAELEPGFYDVCIMADAFVPICYKILITEGKAIERQTRLRLDSQVIKRL